jgi:hypothetical protein
MTRPAFGPVDIIPQFDNAVEDDGLLSFEISRADESFFQFPAEALTYWVVADGDNPVDGNDFTSGALPNGVMVFEEGDASQVLHISLRADNFAEGVETFSLVIAPDPSMPGSRGAGSTDVVILDDDVAGPSSGPSVFMFINGNTGSHFFTADQREAAFIEENLDGYARQGAVVQAAPQAERSAVDVFRYFNTDTGSHFYTANGAERAAIEEHLDGFVFEGVAFQAFSYSTSDDIEPVYRLFDGDSGVHLFTPYEDERDAAVLDGMTDEGVAFFVYTIV